MADTNRSTNTKIDVDDCKKDKGLEVAAIEDKPPAEPFPCDVEQSTAELNQHLPPDHPLLARFQETLREHLLRVKSQLTEDVAIIKHKIKLKEDEREEFGVKLYDMQQEITKQNNLLEDYSQNIHSTVEKRIDEERECKNLRRQYDEKFAEMSERKFRYNQHIVELNHLQDLENNIRNWANEFHDQLITSKRMVSKDAQLQKVNAEEQHKYDLMLFSLESEAKKRREELNGLMEQIDEQKNTNNILHNSLSDANADLEALQQEHKRLTQAWGQVIVAIQHRDRVLFQARESFEKQLESLKLTYSSIEGTRKQISKETEQNIKLKSFKQRLIEDLKGIKRESEKQEKILAKLDMKMEELPRIIEQTEQDFQEAKKESNQIAAQMNSLQFKLDRQNIVKANVEDAILKLAQDQLMCDKASEYRLKVLNLNQESRRGMEANLDKVGKQMSNLLNKLERQKIILHNMQGENNRLGSILKNLNDEADSISNEIKGVEYQIGLIMKQIEKLSKDLDTLLKEAEGCEISPTELKIKSTEKTILDVDAKVQEHQQFWLILQNHIVHLHEKRNLQLNDIQVITKQMLIVSQKSMKINADLEKTEKLANTINRDIENCSTKLEQLSAKCYESNKQHEVIEFDCNMEHAELLNKLRDNEMHVLEIEQEAIDLQNEIDYHKTQVLDLHREALSWETKYKLLDDTIRWRRKESATESEIGNMRAHIHHLQNQYKDLRRIQQKLVKDLDNSVMHRETIFLNASTRQKMEGIHFRSRTNVQQRINDVKSRLKQAQAEISTTEKKLNELILEHGNLETMKIKIKEQIEDEIKENKRVMNEIEQGILLKHQNLEKIVRTQTRAKEYRRLNSLTSFNTRSTKSEESMKSNLQQHAEINHHLIEVAETLLNDFPEKGFVLKRIIHTLRD